MLFYQKAFDVVKKHISDPLHDVSAFSLASDVWTRSACPVSLLSVTAQWIDVNFTLQVTLKVKLFRCSHTSQAVAIAFDHMLKTRGIPRTSVHAVLHAVLMRC